MNRTPLNPALLHDQQQMLARADRSARAVDRIVLAAWRRLVDAVLRAGEDATYWPVAYRAAQAAARNLASELLGGVYEDLADAARHAHGQTVEAALAHIPREHLVAGAALRGVRVTEADDPLPNESPDWARLAASALFPPMSIEDLNRIIFSTDWPQRIEALTRLAAPDAIAGIVAAGLQQGLTPAAIARQLRPLVANVQASARRVVRTESLRVAHETQFEMYEQVPGVVAYQIHSMHFPATRHWHASRDGTIYYRDPKPGQKGFDKMPRPPLEAPDASERPPGTPRVAANCLCWLSPILGAVTGPRAAQLRSG